MARKKKTNTEEPLEGKKVQKRTTSKAVENKNEQPKMEEPPKFIDPPKFDEPVKQEQENVKQDLVMPRRTPTVAVLITMYNSVKTLDYCLASLNSQTVKPDQVVIVDDGSTDRSLDMARRLCPDATFVEMPTNKGIYHATFEGIHAVKCDYVMRLDSDDELTPNFIKEAKELLSQYTYDIIEFPQLRLDPGETAPHDSNMNTPCDIRGVQNCLDVFFRSKLPWYFTGKLFRTETVRMVELPNMPTSIVLDDVMFVMMFYGLATSYVYPNTTEGYIYHFGIGSWSGKKSMTLDYYQRLVETRLIQYNVNVQFLKNIGMYEKYANDFNKLCDFSDVFKYLGLLPLNEVGDGIVFAGKLLRLVPR